MAASPSETPVLTFDALIILIFYQLPPVLQSPFWLLAALFAIPEVKRRFLEVLNVILPLIFPHRTVVRRLEDDDFMFHVLCSHLVGNGEDVVDAWLLTAPRDDDKLKVEHKLAYGEYVVKMPGFEHITIDFMLHFVEGSDDSFDILKLTAPADRSADITRYLEEVRRKHSRKLSGCVMVISVEAGRGWYDIRWGKPQYLRFPGIDGWILPEKQKQSILDMIAHFSKATESDIRDFLCEPHHLGFLLSGRYGTGKSIGPYIIAHILGRPLYIMPLDDKGISNSSMKFLMSKMYPNSVALYDEVHTIPADGKSTGPAWCELNRSGFQKNIDWFAESIGGISCYTTNFRNMLWPALLRPGRVDNEYKLDYLDTEQCIAFFMRYCWETELRAKSGDELDKFKKSEGDAKKLAQEFADKVCKYKYSPAQISKFLRRFLGKPYEAMTAVDEFLEEPPVVDLEADAQADADPVDEYSNGKEKASPVADKFKPLADKLKEVGEQFQTLHESRRSPDSKTDAEKLQALCKMLQQALEQADELRKPSNVADEKVDAPKDELAELTKRLIAALKQLSSQPKENKEVTKGEHNDKLREVEIGETCDKGLCSAQPVVAEDADTTDDSDGSVVDTCAGVASSGSSAAPETDESSLASDADDEERTPLRSLRCTK